MSPAPRSRRTKPKIPISNSNTKRSSAYDDDFEQHLIDHRIYPKGYDYPDRRIAPELALEEFHQRLAQRRPSLSPSQWPDSKFKDFKQRNVQVINKTEVMRNVVPIIAGSSDIPNKQNLLFTRLDPITNDITVDAKPDFYDGARLRDIDKRVRDDIGGYIIPTGHATAPVAPNFFLEVKRRNGDADAAKRQACYDGALGARAMHQLQSYKQEPLYDGNAYTITSTYLAGTLNMYTTHVTQSGPGGSPEYHMSQVGGWNTTGNPNTCRQGFTAFRNARDWAQEQRNTFILAANERARAVNAEPPPFESFDHDDGSDPTGVQDASYLTQVEDAVEPTNFASDFNSFTDTVEAQSAANEGARYKYTDPSTFESSHYNGNPDTTAVHTVKESQSSANELALDTYTQPKASNKRRNKASEKTVSKVPRKSDGRSGRRGSKR